MLLFKLPIITTIALLSLFIVPAHAQSQRNHKEQERPDPTKPKASRPSNQSRHQKACVSRYKSYNPSSDTYLLRGKRVRCRL
ncbi:BA14K family protein [Sphingobium sp.]|uniref:BA14K family protein n=1 Tax=Sphingobium sp. TaxID=1912891 RepID=UPI002B95E5F2|nr:BA14K family protein [Sphingobium sp.]HUD93506.1 BA14K family protein [Sphingobium sp.]